MSEPQIPSPPSPPPSPKESGFISSKQPPVEQSDSGKLQSEISVTTTLATDDSKRALPIESSSSPTTNRTPNKRTTRSPFFATTALTNKPPKTPRPPRNTVSSLPFPPLHAPRFGLIQEELAHDPFRLLIAVTFLIRTHGTAAIPTFRALMDRYPTPEALAAEQNTDHIVDMVRHLGLGKVRAAAIQRYARAWVERPPKRGVRFPVGGGYEGPWEGGGIGDGDDDDDDGSDGKIIAVCAKVEEEEQEDQKPADFNNNTDSMTTAAAASAASAAWEIGHMTQGRYALDSWRIFCRDVLLGRAEDWRGKGAGALKNERGGGGGIGAFQPEWMRVLPEDKELRAYLRWLWMQEGWDWDPKTGEKEVLSRDLLSAVQDGRVEWDCSGGLRIVGS